MGDIGSPAQLLMGRQLCTSLPVKATQLEPRTINPDSVKSHLQQEQQKRKLYYDEGSKPLIPLQKGENAWMQVQGEWKPVKVLDTAEAPASYHVKSASGKVTDATGSTYDLAELMILKITLNQIWKWIQRVDRDK